MGLPLHGGNTRIHIGCVYHCRIVEQLLNTRAHKITPCITGDLVDAEPVRVNATTSSKRVTLSLRVTHRLAPHFVPQHRLLTNIKTHFSGNNIVCAADIMPITCLFGRLTGCIVVVDNDDVVVNVTCLPIEMCGNKKIRVTRNFTSQLHTGIVRSLNILWIILIEHIRVPRLH